MKNKIDKALAASTCICLAPVLLSLAVFDQLPEQVAIHWNSDGNPDNYAPKAIAAFGLPVFFAAINLLVHFTLNHDPKKENASPVLKAVGKWCVPAIAVIAHPITLFIAMGARISVHNIIPALAGILIVVVGNYLPKCKQNFTVGIKLPWTLNSTENWNKTHRAAGYVWIFGGILLIINAFLNLWLATVIIILLLVLVPFVYSYTLYKKGV